MIKRTLKSPQFPIKKSREENTVLETMVCSVVCVFVAFLAVGSCWLAYEEKESKRKSYNKSNEEESE